MNRKEMLNSVSEESRDTVIDIIDEIEGKVKDAMFFLDEIHGMEDLDKVKDCYDELDKLASELY